MRLILVLAWFFAEALVIGDVAERIGALWVFLLILVAAAAGLSLIQRSGWRTVMKLQQAMNQGDLPLPAVISGALGILAGLLLIMPGFLSDAVALSLLLKLGWRRIRGVDDAPGSGPVTLDGEFRAVDPTPLQDETRPHRDDLPPR
ncbi:MAG: FxsA family protein [Oceanococcaceae bacterium]